MSHLLNQEEFKIFMLAQIEEIKRHKWIESQKAGCDVGQAAVADWISTHAAGFRPHYSERLLQQRPQHDISIVLPVPSPSADDTSIVLPLPTPSADDISVVLPGPTPSADDTSIVLPGTTPSADDISIVLPGPTPSADDISIVLPGTTPLG